MDAQFQQKKPNGLRCFWPFWKRWSKCRPKKIRSCRLAVVGESRSGKTSMIFRFSRGRMPEADSEMVSVLETDNMDVLRNGKTIQVIVHDTSGEDDYAKVRALTYNQVDAVLLCLPLNSSEALSRLSSEWVPEVKHLCKGKPYLLVGTKTDLRDEAGKRCQHGNDFISKKQGKQLARTIGAVAYLECSSLDSSDGRLVKRVFGRAIRESLKRQ